MQGVRFRTDLLYMYGRLRGLWHCWRPATFRNSCWRHQCPCARLKHGDWVDLLHSYQYVHAGLLQSLGGAGATVGWRARFVSRSTAATATSRHSIDDGEYCTWSGSRELGLPRAPSNCQHVRHSRHDLRPATSIVCRRHCLKLLDSCHQRQHRVAITLSGLLCDSFPCRSRLRALLHAMCPGLRASTRTELHSSTRDGPDHKHTCAEATKQPGAVLVAKCQPTVAHRATNAMSTPQFSGPPSSSMLGGPTHYVVRSPLANVASYRLQQVPYSATSSTPPRQMHVALRLHRHPHAYGSPATAAAAPPAPLTSRRPSCQPSTCCSAPPGNTKSACGTSGTPRGPRRGTRRGGTGASSGTAARSAQCGGPAARCNAGTPRRCAPRRFAWPSTRR